MFKAGIHFASLFDHKAKKWVSGRKNIFQRISSVIPPDEPVIWMHCASLGEFEQGRPLLEQIRKTYPRYKILLTFFSPSGYEVRKNYEGANWVFYLPMDGAANARRLLEIINPSLVIFVKYEFWYYYLKKLRYRNIPLILVSAVFRNNMGFFKWYGGLQRKMISRFDHLFLQDDISLQLMKDIGLGSISSISGDTRFDRVAEIANQFTPIPSISAFVGKHRVIVAGSTWPEDERVLQRAMKKLTDEDIKLILAPHEVFDKHLEDIMNLFPEAILFSKYSESNSSARVLVIDNYGMLSRLYKYGWLTYVGGGLSKKGIHNVLEAAVYNKIVLFGPYFEKYAEAVGLVQSGGGISFRDDKKNGQLLADIINTIGQNKEEYEYRSRAAGEFVHSNKGATQKILAYIQEKRLLTN